MSNILHCFVFHMKNTFLLDFQQKLVKKSSTRSLKSTTSKTSLKSGASPRTKKSLGPSKKSTSADNVIPKRPPRIRKSSWLFSRDIFSIVKKNLWNTLSRKKWSQKTFKIKQSEQKHNNKLGSKHKMSSSVQFRRKQRLIVNCHQISQIHFFRKTTDDSCSAGSIRQTVRNTTGFLLDKTSNLGIKLYFFQDSKNSELRCSLFKFKGSKAFI